MSETENGVVEKAAPIGHRLVETRREPERAYVIRPVRRRDTGEMKRADAALAEALGLAAAIDIVVLGGEVVRLAKIEPSTLLGKGGRERLGAHIAAQKIGLVVVDGALTPVQQRNLEKAWSCKVIDRTALILEIFGARARTAEGRLQVELAHLNYQRSRLVRSWTHLERQRGGFGFMGGPGESQLEIDRRLIEERIARIEKELATVKQRREIQRKARKRVPHPVVALVGYTNAGKSTLFNRLTGADVLAKDMLFATLDPTMRAMTLPGGRKVILSDTVGFITDLPTGLIAAFRATLEEVIGADLILHVRDVSHADTEMQAASVHEVLRELGLGDAVERGLFEVWNKIDRLDEDARARLTEQAARSDQIRVPVSALTGYGCEALLARVEGQLSQGEGVVEFDLPLSDGAGLAWLYRTGEVLERKEGENSVTLKVRLTPTDRARFAARRGQPATRH